MKNYNISMILALGLIPLTAIIGIPLYTYYNGIVWQEPTMLIIGWFLAGLGITIGYHRLFAHKSFKAKPVFEWIIMLFGSMAGVTQESLNLLIDLKKYFIVKNINKLILTL